MNAEPLTTDHQLRAYHYMTRYEKQRFERTLTDAERRALYERLAKLAQKETR